MPEGVRGFIDLLSIVNISPSMALFPCSSLFTNPAQLYSLQLLLPVLLAGLYAVFGLAQFHLESSGYLEGGVPSGDSPGGDSKVRIEDTWSKIRTQIMTTLSVMFPGLAVTIFSSISCREISSGGVSVTIIHHLSFIIYHLSFIIYHLSFIIYHLSFIIYHHLSSFIIIYLVTASA